jgi:hypothetical protein
MSIFLNIGNFIRTRLIRVDNCYILNEHILPINGNGNKILGIIERTKGYY